jgi:hypothetical protein
MHNERLSDPLEPLTRSLAEVSKKRSKTEADHLEVARREFLGGLYTNGNGPCIPAWNMIRCLQEGATRRKRGKDVLRGVSPIDEHTDVLYDGPRDPDELWKDGGFFLRKGVVVSGRRVPPGGGERELGGLVQQVLGHDERPSVRGPYRG